MNRNHIFKVKEFDVGRYFKFVFFEICGLIILLIIMKVLVDFVGINYLIARLIASIFIGIFLFLMNYIFTFKILDKINFS